MTRCDTQLLNKRTFVAWLKSMDFVTQNDTTGVGNNLRRYKNVLQAMVGNPQFHVKLLFWFGNSPQAL